MDLRFPGNLDFRKSKNLFDSAQANTARSQIFCKFLRENELLSKTTLACLSGVQMASIHEIKKCQKSRDTPPLNVLTFCG